MLFFACTWRGSKRSATAVFFKAVRDCGLLEIIHYVYTVRVRLCLCLRLAFAASLCLALLCQAKHMFGMCVGTTYSNPLPSI